MKLPDFGPGDMCFRDFSKPWYNDHATALCVNAIESLIGESITEFFCRPGGYDLSKRCIEIGAKFNIPVPYATNLQIAGIALQNLIVALEAKGLFSHSQLEERYNSLKRERYGE